MWRKVCSSRSPVFWETCKDAIAWDVCAGTRQDNRNHQRSGSMHLQGYRFFADDEDNFGLEDMLQALMFMKTDSAYVPAKPWQPGAQNTTVTQANSLSKEAQNHLANMSLSPCEA